MGDRLSALENLLGPLPPSEWPLHTSHLSATQLTMFRRCQEQYRHRYLLHEKERPAGALIWGGADHKAHELNFQQKIESHEDLPVGDVELAFAEAFDSRIADTDEEIDWKGGKPGQMKDQGVKLVAACHTLVSPRVQPIAVERKIEVNLPDVPAPILAYLDVETETEVIERKTAKGKVSQVKPDWRLQGGIYQLMTGKPISWHVSAKTKTPRVYTPAEEPGLAIPYSEGYTASILGTVQDTAHQMVAVMEEKGPDERWPGALEHQWACNYCGYRPTCPWWN